LPTPKDLRISVASQDLTTFPEFIQDFAKNVFQYLIRVNVDVVLRFPLRRIKVHLILGHWLTSDQDFDFLPCFSAEVLYRTAVGACTV
jgi:hypothetical protein